ncbi:glycosyltransferase family 2 protein [Candidatus Mcinerneyibacteriota bacterium]|nr:glycosyltransferase family 2 protein [Candidatus Aminicenantes bacterium]MBN2726685.1 glycosyltransferase family 2 protein [Candidatus Mcinerneyibacteriota bacterium]
MEKPDISGKHLQLSIVITVYQGRKFIEQTLESVFASLARSSLAAEIIVVNDSPEEELSFLSKKYPEIILLDNEENLGVAKSRNRGREAARGEFIHFVDYDDWMSESFYPTLEKKISEGADLVLFNVTQHAGREARTFYTPLFSCYFPLLTGNSLLRFGSMMRTIGQLVFKKELMDPLIETEARGGDDYFLYIDLFNKRRGKRYCYVKEPLFNYRIHENNLSKRADFLRSNLECFEVFTGRYPQFRRYQKYLFTKRAGNILAKITGKVVRNIISKGENWVHKGK